MKRVKGFDFTKRKIDKIKEIMTQHGIECFGADEIYFGRDVVFVEGYCTVQELKCITQISEELQEMIK